MADIEEILKYIFNGKFKKNNVSFDEEILDSQKEFKEILHFINGKPQLQFFAINLASNELTLQDKDKKIGTIVVTIGVNYGQNCTGNEAQIVKQDNAIKNMRNNLNRIVGFNKFHLVMTNLSPWITKGKWSEIEKRTDEKLRWKFLTQANRLRYVDGLKKFRKIIWIGHTKSIWPELQNFMECELGLENFYLTYNLSYPWYLRKKADKMSRKIG